MQITLKVNYDFKLPKVPKFKTQSRKLFAGLAPIDPKSLKEEKAPVELQYEYYGKSEIMTVEVVVIAVDTKTGKIVHFNTATTISVLEKSGFSKKTTLNY